MLTIQELGKRAKEASYAVAAMRADRRDSLLLQMADDLVLYAGDILAENEKDLQRAREQGMRESLIDRLMLDKKRIEAMAAGIRQIAAENDPVGKTDCGFTRPNGLEIHKVRVPLGVVGIIYEARPNVTSDAAALCFKAGNAVILRGGKEAMHSNMAIAGILRQTLRNAGEHPDAIALVEDTARETANEMMRLNAFLDVLIPRGGASLIRAVVENATVPVIETGTGNCHIYVDATAELAAATAITVNAKISRPSVCNAAESLLVHESVAAEFLPKLYRAMNENGVQLRGCEKSRAIVGEIQPATEEDFATEYLDLIMSVKIVASVEEACAHINRYGTGHSECIVTKDYQASRYFCSRVDAAAVYVNASTRFTDGGEFGFGAEIGISTQKLHARGPMGLSELTTYKYIVQGDGQVR